MIIIPQRLFEDKQVDILLRNGNVCILKKELEKPVLKREGYISNHVISILLAGEQHIRTYDEKLIQVRAGELLFIPRGMYQITDLLPDKGKFKSLLFYYNDGIIQEFLSNTRLTEIKRQPLPDHLKIQMYPEIEQFAEALIHIYQSRKLNDHSLLRLKILELLHLLNGLTEAETFAAFLFNLTLPQKRNIRTFMEKNYDRPLKIEDYAYLTGRSLSTFRRDFKAYYDTTPQKWLQTKRLDKALEILNKQEISVTNLAYEVGYENISYFIRTFRKQVGKSPKQYMLGLHRNQVKD